MNTLNPDATVASTLSLTLTNDQQQAIDYIQNFLRHPYDPIMTIDGKAGTGKTTVISVIKDYFKGAIICAPTNKAVDVLRQKGFSDATTFDKVVNKTVAHETCRPMTEREITNYQENDWEIPNPPVFKDVVYEKFSREDPTRFVVVDESSMINLEQIKQLKNITTKIICIGDSFQLPPVEGTEWFQGLNHDVIMNQIVRTGAHSEITRLAGMLRMKDKDWEKVIWKKEISKISCLKSEKALADSDVCLTFKNITCNSYNSEIREIRALRGRHECQPVRGDKLMAWQTVEREGIIKGSTYTVIHSMPTSGGFTVRFLESHNGSPIIINVSLANLRDQSTKDKAKDCYPFSFAHCITAHKSQGSEWDNVVVVDDYPKIKSIEQQYWNWLYTAITRAKSTLTIIK